MAELSKVSESAISISLDIAELVGAMAWPVIVLIIVVLLRKQLPEMFKGLGSIFSKVEKISIGDFSLELAKVTATSPHWTSSNSAYDLRKSMRSMEVTDSYVSSFIDQLTDTTPIDYITVDLGKGDEWLASRLFILSILLERSKGLNAIVFVRYSGQRTKRLIGWAEPKVVRWAFAIQYPWLEQAYASSYSSVFNDPNFSGTQVVSFNGMLGMKANSRSSSLLIDLMQKYLSEIQNVAAPTSPEEVPAWVELNGDVPTWEHTNWLTSDGIEDILGDFLYTKFVYAKLLDSISEKPIFNRLLSISQRYIPVVDDSERFKELIDRDVLVEQAFSESRR